MASSSSTTTVSLRAPAAALRLHAFACASPAAASDAVLALGRAAAPSPAIAALAAASCELAAHSLVLVAAPSASAAAAAVACAAASPHPTACALPPLAPGALPGVHADADSGAALVGQALRGLVAGCLCAAGYAPLGNGESPTLFWALRGLGAPGEGGAANEHDALLVSVRVEVPLASSPASSSSLSSSPSPSTRLIVLLTGHVVRVLAMTRGALQQRHLRLSLSEPSAAASSPLQALPLPLLPLPAQTRRRGGGGGEAMEALRVLALPTLTPALLHSVTFAHVPPPTRAEAAAAALRPSSSSSLSSVPAVSSAAVSSAAVSPAAPSDAEHRARLASLGFAAPAGDATSSGASAGSTQGLGTQEVGGALDYARVTVSRAPLRALLLQRAQRSGSGAGDEGEGEGEDAGFSCGDGDSDGEAGEDERGPSFVVPLCALAHDVIYLRAASRERGAAVAARAARLLRRALCGDSDGDGDSGREAAHPWRIRWHCDGFEGEARDNEREGEGEGASMAQPPSPPSSALASTQPQAQAQAQPQAPPRLHRAPASAHGSQQAPPQRPGFGFPPLPSGGGFVSGSVVARFQRAEVEASAAAAAVAAMRARDAEGEGESDKGKGQGKGAPPRAATPSPLVSTAPASAARSVQQPQPQQPRSGLGNDDTGAEGPEGACLLLTPLLAWLTGRPVGALAPRALFFAPSSPRPSTAAAASSAAPFAAFSAGNCVRPAPNSQALVAVREAAACAVALSWLHSRFDAAAPAAMLARRLGASFATASARELIAEGGADGGADAYAPSSSFPSSALRPHALVIRLDNESDRARLRAERLVSEEAEGGGGGEDLSNLTKAERNARLARLNANAEGGGGDGAAAEAEGEAKGTAKAKAPRKRKAAPAAAAAAAAAAAVATGAAAAKRAAK